MLILIEQQLRSRKRPVSLGLPVLSAVACEIEGADLASDPSEAAKYEGQVILFTGAQVRLVRAQPHVHAIDKCASAARVLKPLTEIGFFECTCRFLCLARLFAPMVK